LLLQLLKSTANGDRWAAALPGMYLYHYELVSLTKTSFYADVAADLVQMRRLGQVVVSISIFHPGTVLNTTAAATGNPLRVDDVQVISGWLNSKGKILRDIYF
jgi:hypothetical protein